MDLAATLQAALADRYRVERELGRGGMAIVYLADDLRHGRRVAIKVLRPELAASLGSERFLREISLASALQHPHILPLYDSGSHTTPAGELLYYVMPYVEGESLRQRMDRERHLPIEEALLLAREVLDALGAAHATGVIHRDIKPENILLSGGHALVVDFGIARAVGLAGGERLTDTGLAIGTPAYMSPEQAAAEREVDARTDLYSLASVLYEMLTGEPPFSGATAQALLLKRLTETPPSAIRLRDTIPPEVDAALHRGLARVPADRYPTAAAFSAALRPGLGVAGGTPVPGPPSRRFPVALAFGTLLVAAAALFLWARRPS
ncbi:MAG TPA: serine/threonine-protein kinase, partial [Gemmatimonadales bacterium]|nr:serine/threonine-protein kinase [Gemmatimonadales bacterium]